MSGRRFLVLLLVPALWLSLTPVAQARLVAKSSLVETSTGAFKIKVKLSSTRPVTKRTKPRSVKMKAGGETYPLKLSSKTTRTNLGTWKSEAYTGAQQQALFQQIDQTVKIVVKSLSGTNAINSKLNPPAGWTTGQAAIDEMEQVISGGAVQYFQSSSNGDTESFQLHLCTDKVFRWYHRTNFAGGAGFFVYEKFGQPWEVTEALIIREDYAGATIEGTFTVGHGGSSGYEDINEPTSAGLEYYQGQWYWDGNAAEVIEASCEPGF